jgi:hypothetical protein
MTKNVIVLVFSLLMLPQLSFSQKTDSTKKPYHFGGTITATQNGISLIPSFSLSKPALLFDMNMGNKKLTFEPLFRFATDGKPWAFVFWFRYKVITDKKFRLSIGAHPSYVFKTITTSINGIATNVIQASRYAAGDIAPNYFVSKNTSVGLYYLYSHGLDKTSVQNTHFITVNSNFSYIKITGSVYAKLNPQLYYLRQDGKDGFYFTNALTLAHKKFPFSVQTIINKAIRTSIGGKNFVWNASLIYSFNKNYARQ